MEKKKNVTLLWALFLLISLNGFSSFAQLSMSNRVEKSGELDTTVVAYLSRLKNNQRSLAEVRTAVTTKGSGVVITIGDNSDLGVVTSINALNNYSGKANFVYLNADGVQGFFKYVPSGSPQADNGVVVASGRGGSWERVLDSDRKINVKWYGAKGDGKTDDTPAIQKAIAYAAQIKAYAFLPSGTYLLKQTLQTPRGLQGILGESKLATTLMPTNGLPVTLQISTPGWYQGFTIGTYKGLGQRIQSNGIWIQGEKAKDAKGVVLLSRMFDIRVMGLDGYGMKFENVYDSYFSSLSVEQCGNANNYAFQVLATHGETSNVSTWDRIQVESSNRKAIYVHPNVLSCVFSNVHAERQNDVAGDTCFFLGGNRCLYEQCRLQCSNSKGLVSIEAFNTFFNTFGLESANPVSLNAINGSSLTFLNFYMPRAIVQTRKNQIGKINFLSGLLKSDANRSKQMNLVDVKEQ